MKIKFEILGLSLFMLLFICWPVYGEVSTCFMNSLHHTGEGMRYWYEAEDGFMQITGTPYEKLGCKNCHVKSCDDCHLEKTEDGLAYSNKKARSSATCLKCHAREKATIAYDEMMKCMGVHADAFIACVDCHTTAEIHGDGTFYHSIRQEGAMKAACTDCHTHDADEYSALPQTRSHQIHQDKLACNACHVQNTISCYNCHFGELAKTGSKPKSFMTKVKDFLLLVKFRGKVTSGTMQTLVGKNNEPFIAYVPYFTHSVSATGRKCEECHNTNAVNILSRNEPFIPAWLSDQGKLEFYKGVIPLVPDLLKWPFFEKKDGNWVPIKPESEPMIQLGLYAEPFTANELIKLSTPQKYQE